MPRPIRLAALFLSLLGTSAFAGTPPFPPATLPSGVALGDYQPAPTPDQDLSAPYLTPPAVQATPAVFGLREIYRGDGYTYGSSPQGYADRSETQVPGVTVRVQLQ